MKRIVVPIFSTGILGIGIVLYVLWGNIISIPNKLLAETVSMNEVISDSNDVEFSVTDVEVKNVIDEGEHWEISTEGNFVIPKIEIFNNGDEAYDVNPLNFVIVSDGKEYEYCSDAWFAGEQEYGDNYMYLDTINPGIKKEYYLAFEIPKDLEASNCKLKIMDNAFVNMEDVYIELKQ